MSDMVAAQKRLIQKLTALMRAQQDRIDALKQQVAAQQLIIEQSDRLLAEQAAWRFFQESQAVAN